MASSTALEFWQARSAGARAALVAGALLIVAGAALAAAWVLRADPQPLFSDLDPRDAAAIAAELDRLKVPYTVGDDGGTLLVDRPQVHATRMKVMGKGVDLKGSVGFELFNSTDFGMTEFAQKINYQRALQGELARTIGAIAEVKSARVHLVLPESGLLRRTAVRPKASVSLVLRGRERLHPQQVQGIQRLVAAAVPEMDAASVTVLDPQGVALSRRAEPDGDGGAAGSRFEAKREIEDYLARKVVAVLDQALGPGRAIVSVDVALSHDHVKVTREDVVPAATLRDGAIARRKDVVQRAANLVTTADGMKEAPRPSGASTSEVEFQHGRKVEQVVSAPGSVRRISVGVVLPASVDAAEADGLRQVVAMAVGLNAERGDGIALTWVGRAAEEVAGAEAPAAAAPAAPAPAAVASPPSLWLAAAGVGVLGLLGGPLAWRWARRRPEAAPSLTAEQREEMLARVKRWIASDTAPRPGPSP
jgi:flagellar M-ring protein FliF